MKTEEDRIKELLERAGRKNLEVRTLPVEFRITRKEDGALPRIEGYASVFNSDSEDMGFIEQIKPGAFKDALKISDSRALWNHDPNYVLGRQSSGTLELKEDKVGLWMSINPPDTQLVRDMVLTPIERGDVREQSFGFTIEADEWKDLDTDKPRRTIVKVKELFDVSPVTYPAFQDTSVALRSLKKAKAEAEDKPAFSEPMVVVTFGEETKEFSLNDKGEINRWLEGLTGEEEPEGEPEPEEKKSELSPTTADPDNAVDEPTLDKPTDTTEVMERWDKKLMEYGKGN